MPHARLTDRACLTVTGAEAEDFLQNLVTSDLGLLQDGEARPSALLTPQGKILFDFLVSRIADGYRLDVASVARAALLKRLTLYKLRAKVALASIEDSVFALWGEAAADGALVDRRFGEDSVLRLYGEAPAGIDPAPAEAFAALRIRTGVAEAETDFPGADVFPHDVLLDQNGGVSFKKGCYVGQEVVSRMQHRGTARRRVMLVAAERHLTPGVDILAGGKSIGTVLSAVDGEAGMADGMAMMRIDRLAQAMAADLPLTAEGVALEATIPPWAGFALPVLDTAASEAE